MLGENVVPAVERGEFHPWSVSMVDDGLSVLMSRDADDVHQAVRARLRQIDETVNKLAFVGDKGCLKTICRM
jgi:hypothetical protein